MDRASWLDLARRGLCLPIGTDLLLHEERDPESVAHDGEALGRVLARAAERYRIPLAIPQMDLRREKEDLLRALGIAGGADNYTLTEDPGPEAIAAVEAAGGAAFAGRSLAHVESVRYIASRTRLVPVGMAIGPFSLMTKLLADPITLVALAGAGATEDAGVRLAYRALELARWAVLRSVRAQLEAGARLMIICEPAANRQFLSPRQAAAGSDVFERFVLAPMSEVGRAIEDGGAGLFFHDCGELTEEMLRTLATRLDPIFLSLGSSRRLWEDADLVPEHVILYGNLPTKSFYSDSVMPVERVRELTRELCAQMAATRHPFVLGSECDVLHVPEAAEAIREKVDAMLAEARRAA